MSFSNQDFPIYIPPVPKLNLSKDIGVPSVQDFSVPQGLTGDFVQYGDNESLGTSQKSFIFRQLSGDMAVADSAGNATVSELRTGILAIYTALSDQAAYGDVLTLTNASGGALVARFIVMLQDDNAGGENTISFTSGSSTFYAINITSTSAASLTDAFDEYFTTVNNMNHPDDRDLDVDSSVASKSMPFTISLNDTYTDTSGVLTLNTSNPTVSVVEGSYEPMQGFSHDIDSGLTHDVTATLSSGSTVFILVFVKYILEFTGTQGSRIVSGFKTGAEPQLEFIESQSPSTVEGGDFNSDGSEYTHYDLVGIVGITTRGTRRTARIIQKFAGDQTGIRNFASKNAGSGADAAKGVTADMTKSGIREVTLCLNGHPYSTFILTGPLLAI